MKKEDNLTIGKCRNCKSFWRINQLKEVIFKVPSGDGFLQKKDFLCLSCFHNLDLGLKAKKTQLEKDL